MAATGGVVAGIVICSLLFLIVIALVIYNIYLYQRRRASEKRHRERQVNRQWDVDHGWRPRDILYSSQDDAFREVGNVNSGYRSSTGSVTNHVAGQSENLNPGYNGSTMSVTMKGASRSRVSGSAPRAQDEDDYLSGDESDGAVPKRYSNPSSQTVNVHKPRRPALRESSVGRKVPNQDQGYRPTELRAYVGNSQNHPRPLSYDNVAAVDAQPHNALHKIVAAPRPEVTLRPQQLAAQWERKPPPPMFSQKRYSADGHQSGYLAVLSAEAANMRPSDASAYDVSLTGCGAQHIPNLGLVPPSGGSVLNGVLQYNQY